MSWSPPAGPEIGDEKVPSDSRQNIEFETVDGDAEALSVHEDDTTLGRRVLWRMDTRLLPALTVLFLLSFIDRTNVGNAKILGLQKDLGLSDHEFAIGVAALYTTYIACEIPSNLVLKKVSPKIWLPLLTAVWGVFTMCIGFVKGFGSFVAVRVLLGVAEGGLFPGIVLYLSHFYRRTELALRIGIIYTATSLSGAFGGLLARGLNEIGYKGGLEGWRWIFIVEGLMTVVIGALTVLALPNTIESARFLNPTEKAYARHRLTTDHQKTLAQEEKFTWSEVRRGILNLQVWLSASAYFTLLCGIYSFGLFLPTIINNLKFAHDPNTTQLWTVPPYAVAAFFTVIVAILSDRLALRGTLMLFTIPIAIIGYAIIFSSSNPRVQYAMTFLMATGMYASVPCILTWNSNNSAGHYKRATTAALQLGIANCGGFFSSFLYPRREAPRFRRSHGVMVGLLCAAWVLIAANVLWCRKINRDKERGRYAKWEGKGDDRDPNFKMVL